MNLPVNQEPFQIIDLLTSSLYAVDSANDYFAVFQFVQLSLPELLPVAQVTHPLQILGCPFYGTFCTIEGLSVMITTSY